MMLNKKSFIEYINFIKKMQDSEMRIYHFLSEEITDFSGFIYSKYESKFVDLLAEAMGDKGEWIAYFIYELNFGENWKEGTVTEKDGTDIRLQTPEDLYIFLTENK